MQISVDRPDLRQFVEEQIRTGQYPTPDAVVECALEYAKLRQEALPSGEELKRLIAEGQADADRGKLIPGSVVFRELMQRSAERRAQRTQ